MCVSAQCSTWTLHIYFGGLAPQSAFITERKLPSFLTTQCLLPSRTTLGLSGNAVCAGVRARLGAVPRQRGFGCITVVPSSQSALLPGWLLVPLGSGDALMGSGQGQSCSPLNSRQICGRCSVIVRRMFPALCAILSCTATRGEQPAVVTI